MAPHIVLHDTARARAERIGLTDIALSLSHSKGYAVASVVGQSSQGNLVRRDREGFLPSPQPSPANGRGGFK